MSAALVVAALLAVSLAFVSPAAAQASNCSSSQVDLSTANWSQVAQLNGMTDRAAKKLVALRTKGKIAQLEDLRILRINDRRFLSFANDARSCFDGRAVAELFPDAICATADARINTGTTGSLAERIGWKNARPLVAARPIDNLSDVSAIPERGKKILGRLARKGGTCLDPVAPNAATSMGAGTFLVGSQIVPGRYVAKNVSGCYWERGSAKTSTSAAVIASKSIGNAQQVIADIASSDTSFTSTGCGTWVAVADANLSTIDGVPGDGDWLIGTQVTAGIYRASSPAGCTWARQAGLSGQPTDPIDTSQLPSKLTLIDLRSSDAAFTSTGCGTWELVPAACMNQLEAIHPAIPEVKPHIYGVSDSVLLSTRWEMEMTMKSFTFNWGGFGGLNTRDAPPIVEIEIGEQKVTGTTVIVGLGHNYRGSMLADFPGYIDTMINTFPSHVDRVIWVAPSRFNSTMPDVVRMLNEATARWPQMEIADFWIEGDAQNHPEWFEDDLHHDAVGRQAISNYLNDKLLFPCG